MKKKSFLKIFLFCLVIVIMLGGTALYLKASTVKHPLKSQDSKVKFTVKSGETLNNVIDNLKKQNNMQNVYFVKSYIKKNNIKQDIKPGQYSFSENISLEQLTRYLNKGIKDDQPVKIVIPEGYDLEHIAASLEKKDIISKADFIKSCKEYSVPNFIKNNPERKYALEGYLFPDTYEFLKGTEGKDFLR